MTKWIVSIAVVVIIAGVGWFYRGAIGALFSVSPQSAPAQMASSTNPMANWLTYASTTMGISIQYPPDWSPNATYVYTGVAGHPVPGLSITIPQSMASGTNLGADTYLSVEQLPRARFCTGDIFVPDNVTATDVVDNGLTYSVATTTGAGAGNRYEEQVWAIKDSKPCTAVRYFIHWGVIENYPPGAVQEFDHAALTNAMDQIRRTLVLTGGATSTPTGL